MGNAEVDMNSARLREQLALVGSRIKDRERDNSHMQQELEQSDANIARLDAETEALREMLKQSHTLVCNAKEEYGQLQDQRPAQANADRTQVDALAQAEKNRLMEELDKVDAENIRLRALLQNAAQDAQNRRPVHIENESNSAAHCRRRSYSDADNKENQVCNHVVSEQKRLLSELERRLQREKTAAVIATPSEFAKIAKRLDIDGITHENADLRMQVAGLQTELRQLRWHSDILLKYLPPTAREHVASELQAQPLPTQEKQVEALL